MVLFLSFCFNSIHFSALPYNKLLFSDCVKLIGSCVGPSLITNIFLLLLSTCTDELISPPKVITFLCQLQCDHENCKCASNPIP